MPSGWTALHVVALADRLADTVGAIENAARTTAPRAEVRLSGCGRWERSGSFWGARASRDRGDHDRVRHRIAAIGVAPSSLAERRSSGRPWTRGADRAGILRLMRALRDEFDPRRVLNPGRYVGGL